MKTYSVICEYIYQDVTYDLFFYLSDFDLFVTFENTSNEHQLLIYAAE